MGNLAHVQRRDCGFCCFEHSSNRSGTAAVTENLPILERFVALMYDRTDTSTGVNDARKALLTKKRRTMDAIPPTAAALVQHTKRVAYQAGYISGGDPCRQMRNYPARVSGAGRDHPLSLGN